MVAARIANLNREDTLKQNADVVKTTTAVPQAQVTDTLNVSRCVVSQARQILERAIPELVAAADSGKLSHN
jgi:hypothetical protein